MGPAKHEKVAIYKVNQRISNVCRIVKAALQRKQSVIFTTNIKKTCCFSEISQNFNHGIIKDDLTAVVPPFFKHSITAMFLILSITGQAVSSYWPYLPHSEPLFQSYLPCFFQEILQPMNFFCQCHCVLLHYISFQYHTENFDKSEGLLVICCDKCFLFSVISSRNRREQLSPITPHSFSLYLL